MPTLTHHATSITLHRRRAPTSDNDTVRSSTTVAEERKS